VATPAISAAQRATATIAIIMTPAPTRLVSGSSKASPIQEEISPDWRTCSVTPPQSASILHAIVPNAKRIGVLMSSNTTHQPIYKIAEAVAQLIKLSSVSIVAAAPSDLPLFSVRSSLNYREEASSNGRDGDQPKARMGQ
jgi:hypothetical protein